MVETANGGLTKKGTVKIKIVDMFQPSKSRTVYLNDVLYVPDLNRRLLSVSEWNQCGGEISFLHDRCRLRLLNEDNTTDTTIDIEPIYSLEMHE
jgi:hypothetical protein